MAGDTNATPDKVPMLAIRADAEDTGKHDLAGRERVPIAFHAYRRALTNGTELLLVVRNGQQQ